MRLTGRVLGAGIGGPGAETASILAVEQVLIGQMRQIQRIEDSAVGRRAKRSVENGAAESGRAKWTAHAARGQRGCGDARNHAPQTVAVSEQARVGEEIIS